MSESSQGGGAWGSNSSHSAGTGPSAYMGGSPGDGYGANSAWSSSSQPQGHVAPVYGPSHGYHPPSTTNNSVYIPGSITQFAQQQQQQQQQQYQALQPPPQQQQYAAPSSEYYTASQSRPDQQQLMGNTAMSAAAVQPPLPSYRPVPMHDSSGASVVSVGSTGNSYAARSARAYATTTGAPMIQPGIGPPTPMPPPQQQQQQQQQQQYQQTAQVPPPTMLSHQAIPGPPQDRVLTDCTRRVQEHAYYMRQAMELDDLSTVLDRAAHMLSELGEAHGSHGSTGAPGHAGGASGGGSSLLTPKSYYELHIRALEEMPNLEEYLFNKSQQQMSLSQSHYSMLQLYEFVQFCPQVLPRLYLQICTGSALIRSKEVGAKWVLNHISAVTKSVQNPTRGLFLRHFLLQAFRDKLPDQPDDVASAPSDETGTVDATIMEPGSVKDAYEFVLANFVEMNKLWVRLQHLPGEGKSKEQRKRRERERNDLRVLVGMNLVRLSQLEGVTSRIYGQVILPEILNQIVVCGDPLAQAYLMDCIIQVFPDEYHIETLPILLNVCPKLRDKVNIRTILQSLMDRLSNYYAEEELLDENDSNQVKKNLARDSLPLFEDCVQKVYNARGPKLTSKEVIRLQTALVNFSLKSCPGDLRQIDQCLEHCVAALRQAAQIYANVGANGTVAEIPAGNVNVALDEVAASELEKLLVLIFDALALNVLQLRHFSILMSLLPTMNRRVVGVALQRSVVQAAVSPPTVMVVKEIFNMIAPVFDGNILLAMSSNNGYVPPQNVSSGSDHVESVLLAKLVHLLGHDEFDVALEMFATAQQSLAAGEPRKVQKGLVALVYALLRLVDRGFAPKQVEVVNGGASTEEFDSTEQRQEQTSSETPVSSDVVEDVPNELDDSVDVANGEENLVSNLAPSGKMEETAVPIEQGIHTPTTVTLPPDTADIVPLVLKFRSIFVLLQQTIAMVAVLNPEMAFKLYLQATLAGDRMAAWKSPGLIDSTTFEPIAFELISQALAVYDESLKDNKSQLRCIEALVGCLLRCRSLSRPKYDSMVTKTAQLAARMQKRQDQCEMVALCANLFYPIGRADMAAYSNPQRSLECLQRALKLADACTASNPADVRLFVDLLDHYIVFFEHGNPVISDSYIVGLISLIREHMESIGTSPYASMVSDAREQFHEILRYIKRKKEDVQTQERFQGIHVEAM